MQGRLCEAPTKLAFAAGSKGALPHAEQGMAGPNRSGLVLWNPGSNCPKWHCPCSELEQCLGRYSMGNTRRTTCCIMLSRRQGSDTERRHTHVHAHHLQELSIGTAFHLETCWWVPLLFGVAAVILGLSHPLLDRTRMLEGFRTLDFMFASSPMGGKAPSWLFVNAGISSFTWQYALSGVLAEASGGSDPSLGACLFLFAVAQWATYDHTKGGLLMAILCAIGGPSLEIVLINVGGLYSYTHPDILGIPLWIPWVYFAGAPAVGNLGRRVFHINERKYELSRKG
eukprot:SM000054S18127  [mRNA]  locus=s54:753473:755547:+ [translate_table: standard]